MLIGAIRQQHDRLLAILCIPHPAQRRRPDTGKRRRSPDSTSSRSDRPTRDGKCTEMNRFRSPLRPQNIEKI
jgi:hypothetical protein